MLWHKPTEKPCAGHKLWILNADGGIDWPGSNTVIDVSKSRGWMYFNEVCEALRFNAELLEALAPVQQEILNRHGYPELVDGSEGSLNDDYHLVITITVAEAKAIMAARRKAGA
ncbi:MAG: hypothetical protein WCI51_02130 [Lentisphaerota bacterium]